MANELQTAWRDDLQRLEPQITRALPEQINADRFVRAAETAIGRDQKLLQCDRKSLFEAIMISAECGLMPNGRDAALVRFKNNVQFIPMFSGLLRLIRNTGEVKELVVEVVKDNDDFTYSMGDNPKIDHTPIMDDRGETIAAYAILKTKDGGTYRAMMSRDEINKIRNASPGYRYAESKGQKNTPWHTSYDEMAKKTALRRLAKICPLSTDRLDLTLEADNATVDLGAFTPTTEPTISEKIGEKLRANRQIEGKVIDNGRDNQVDIEPEVIDAQSHQKSSETKENTDVQGDPQVDIGRDIFLTDKPVWESLEECQAEFMDNVLNQSDAQDLTDSYKGWVDMVEGTFVKKIAEGLTSDARPVFNQKKLELEKQ